MPEYYSNVAQSNSYNYESLNQVQIHQMEQQQQMDALILLQHQQQQGIQKNEQPNHQQQQQSNQSNGQRRRIRKQKNNASNNSNESNEDNLKPKNEENLKDKKGKKILEDVSIEEALKALTMTSEGACSAVKTPVSVLQELLSRRGITPTYDLVQIEGAIHEPTFRYRVTFGTKDDLKTAEAMGAGRSKKEAKHQAARNLIDKLTGIQISDQILPPTTAESTNNNEDSTEAKVNGNPIGWLQELCMARRWPPPCYETEDEVGLPHERQFTIACLVSTYREIGCGKSKKVAKRLAAQKMWQRLQNLPMEAHDENDDINRVGNTLNRYADLKEKHISTLTNQHSFKVSQFHKTLKSKCGNNLKELQSTCLNNKAEVNYVQFLQEIATEQQFEVTYVDIEEKTFSGNFQCLVQLSTLPVAVCQGSGKTSKAAQTNAARNALEYLKIMTKM